MALTYRSPVEEVLTLFEPAAQSLVAATATASYQQNEKDNFEWFNFSMPAIAKERLSTAGIYLSPYSGYPHSHPVCKTLENYILYKVLPSIINNSFYFVGIKQFKINFLKKRFKHLSLVQAINRYVSSADKIRYGNEFVVRASSECRLLKRHRSIEQSCTLSSLVPNIKTGANLFLHDELHYWSKDDIIDFLEVCQPEIMLGTVVYPTEIFAGAKHSLNPWCYEFEVKGRVLIYYPDGVRSEGYEQPIDGGYLLQANRILLPNGITYCVDVIASKFSHHLVSITRGDLVVPKYRSFGPFDAVRARGAADIARKNTLFFPVSHLTILRVYRYLRSLKKPDKQSAMAKFSQLCHDPSGEAIKFMEEFSTLVMETDNTRTVLRPELIKSFFGNLGRRLPSCFAAMFARTCSMCLDEFITFLEPLTIDVTLQTLSKNSLYYALIDQGEAESFVDPFEELECAWEGRDSFLLDRPCAKYAGLLPLTDCKGKWALPFNMERLRHGLLKLYMEASQSCYTGRSWTIQDYINSILTNTTVIGRAFLKSLTPELLDWLQYNADCLEPKPALWHDCGVRWFIHGTRNSAKIAFLESSVQIDARAQYESCGYMTPGRTRTFKLIPTLTDTEVYTFYEPEIIRRSPPPLEPSGALQGTPLTVGNTVADTLQQPFPIAGALTCDCGIIMNLKDVLGHTERIDEFTDNLRGRQAAWYSMDGRPYKYNGGDHVSKGWPNWLQMWMALNGVDKKYNCMLAQKYQADSCLGFHADDEALFVAGESILTVNITGEADFKVTCPNGAGELRLQEAQMFEMPPGFQQTHKHAVANCTAGRISYTFRVATTMAPELPVAPSDEEDDGRRGYTDGAVEVSYQQLEGANFQYRVIKNQGGGDCFWLALEHYTGVKTRDMKKALLAACKPIPGSALAEQLRPTVWASDESIKAVCTHLGWDITIIDEMQNTKVVYINPGNENMAIIRRKRWHFEAIEPLAACTIKALASCLDRRFTEVSSLLYKRLGTDFMDNALAGQGMELETFREMLVELQICAVVEQAGGTIMLNDKGQTKGIFKFLDGHAEHVKEAAFAPHVQLNVYKADLECTPEMYLPIREACTATSYTPDVSRATLLASCLLNGSTGVLCSELFNDRGTLMPTEPCTSEREMMLLLGVPGCGKSRAIRETLPRARGRALLYITPRRVLLDEFEGHLNSLRKRMGAGACRNFKALTFEKALINGEKFAPGALVVLDEIQLYPPGYLDLLCCRLNPTIRLVLLGDPCQSDYDSKKDRNVLGAIPSDILNLLEGTKYKYNVLSRRFQSEIFISRLPCTLQSNLQYKGSLKIVEGLDAIDLRARSSEVCLVSSFDEKKIATAYFGVQCKTMTFGESTGATFTTGSILVTSVSQHTNERRWITALSRFRKNITIVNATGVSIEIVQKTYANRVFGRFLCMSAKNSDLLTLLPGEPEFTVGFTCEKYGADEGKREEKLQGDPWLKTMVDLLQVEDIETIEEAKEIIEDEWCKTHLPQCELEGVRARWVHKILAKESREKRMGHLVSEQFTDEHSKQPGHRLTNAAERFETIYPRHKAADTVTFIMAVRKRLRFSHPVKEAAKLNQALPYGPFLLKEFLARVPLKPAHNARMMAESKFDFEEKKTSKSAAIIENHSNRSMREWAIDIGLIFSKSQICTKYDNRFRDAKAAQTIVCFQHSVLCRFAPYMRYIEKKLNEALPAKYYIHSGKGLDELSAWVKIGGFGDVCTESDYEAFDASQDQYIMAFEICLMRYLGLPHSLVEDYKFIKTHLGSKLGNFAIMRFSGEASTFLFNTMANMLFTFLRYDIKGNERICFAGDDMCSNKRLFVSSKHADFLGKLKLKAKVAHTKTPTFCGWNLCPHGIFKKPQLVFERLCIAKETNNLVNCIDNYAIEVAFAYKMGERARERMDEEELEAFYNCVRIIVKNKHLLKSDVRNVYEEQLD
nr:RNA-dependent RNA polymerase [Lily symptomless virus]